MQTFLHLPPSDKITSNNILFYPKRYIYNVQEEPDSSFHFTRDLANLEEFIGHCLFPRSIEDALEEILYCCSQAGLAQISILGKQVLVWRDLSIGMMTTGYCFKRTGKQNIPGNPNRMENMNSLN